MDVTWEVDDGYAGGARTQITEVPDDLIRECVSQEEAMATITQFVQEDFESQITWDIRGGDEMQRRIAKLIEEPLP